MAYWIGVFQERKAIARNNSERREVFAISDDTKRSDFLRNNNMVGKYFLVFLEGIISE